MQVNRIEDVKTYDAPGHFDVETLRLQGLDASDAKAFSIGISHFQPGGGCEHAGSPPEKAYVLLSGELTVITDDGEVTLKPMDSCYIAPNENRSIINRGSEVATLLVVMAS